MEEREREREMKKGLETFAVPSSAMSTFLAAKSLGEKGRGWLYSAHTHTHTPVNIVLRLQIYHSPTNVPAQEVRSQMEMRHNEKILQLDEASLLSKVQQILFGDDRSSSGPQVFLKRTLGHQLSDEIYGLSIQRDPNETDKVLMSEGSVGGEERRGGMTQAQGPQVGTDRQANIRHNGSLCQELLCGLHALDLFQHLDSNLLTLKFPLPNLC